MPVQPQASLLSLQHCSSMLYFVFCPKNYLSLVILTLAKAVQYMLKGAMSLFKS